MIPRIKHVCLGMVYLEKMRVLHRDLALRNLLVDFLPFCLQNRWIKPMKNTQSKWLILGWLGKVWMISMYQLL